MFQTTIKSDYISKFHRLLATRTIASTIASVAHPQYVACSTVKGDPTNKGLRRRRERRWPEWEEEEEEEEEVGEKEEEEEGSAIALSMTMMTMGDKDEEM
jgi:hypothetical protein